MTQQFLAGRRIGLSVSESGNLAQLGLGPEHVQDALVEVTRYLVAAGATVVYAGDLRAGGFTELLVEVVARHQIGDERSIRFENFLAWPVHACLPHADLVGMSEMFAPSGRLIYLDASGLEMLPAARATFDRQDVDDHDWGPALTAMREMLAQHCDARIVAGGATQNFKGFMPGVAEEALSSLAAGKPTYVLGGLGGCALDIASQSGLVTAPIDNPTAWPGRNWFDDAAETLNPGLETSEAAALAASTHGDDMLVLLLKGLQRMLPDRLPSQNPGMG